MVSLKVGKQQRKRPAALNALYLTTLISEGNQLINLTLSL